MGSGCLITKRISDELQVQMGIDSTANKRGDMSWR